MRFVSLLAVLVFIASEPVRAQFGIAAGVNYEQMEEIDVGDVRGTFERASGYHVGLFYDLGSGPIGLRIGAFYRDLGDLDFSLAGVEAVRLTMFDFPIDVRLNVLPIPVLHPFVFGGPVLSVPRSDDADLDASLETLYVAGAVGGGFQFDLGGILLIPEFRYGIAISELTGETFRIAGEEFDASQGPRGNSAQVRVGLRF